jgi:hypothetical protein
MTMNTLRREEKGRVFDHARLVLCRIDGFEFSRRFKDLLIHGVLRDGSGWNEEVHIMLAAADVEALVSFLAGCQVRSMEVIDASGVVEPAASVGSAAGDRTEVDRT